LEGCSPLSSTRNPVIVSTPNSNPNPSHPHLSNPPKVGLAGASGSGKTAFSERVKSFMPGIAVISMDNYNDSSKLVGVGLGLRGWVGGLGLIRALWVRS